MTTHGMKGTKIYTAWQNMKRRCDNKNEKPYKNYGGRGITYDPKWKFFESFYNDMKDGYKEGLTLDRKENNLIYNKQNCRWVTMKTQQRNKRNNIYYKGKLLVNWCNELGLNYHTVYSRLFLYGWSE